MTQYTLS